MSNFGADLRMSLKEKFKQHNFARIEKNSGIVSYIGSRQGRKT